MRAATQRSDLRWIRTWITLAAAVVLTTGLCPDSGTAHSLTNRTSNRFAGADSVLLGVSTPSGPYDISQVERFERLAGKTAAIVVYYQSFAHHEFDASLAETVRSRGSLPMIVWEPWDYLRAGSQPAFALRRIIEGDYDAYVRRWANGLREWEHPILLSFAPEMNGNARPWAVGVNGNTAKEYVVAYRRIHSIVQAAGADNVIWVWQVIVDHPGSAALRALFPGDRYVDWIGVDGYNWGTTRPWSRWQPFDQVFGRTLSQLRSLGRSTKPLMIAETASTEVGGDKAAWLQSFFADLGAPEYQDIRALVWFQHDKETDWRIDSSEAARAAFARGVANPRYIGTGTISAG